VSENELCCLFSSILSTYILKFKLNDKSVIVLCSILALPTATILTLWTNGHILCSKTIFFSNYFSSKVKNKVGIIRFLIVNNLQNNIFTSVSPTKNEKAKEK
jgi:hypothetical protein